MFVIHRAMLVLHRTMLMMHRAMLVLGSIFRRAVLHVLGFLLQLLATSLDVLTHAGHGVAASQHEGGTHQGSAQFLDHVLISLNLDLCGKVSGSRLRNRS